MKPKTSALILPFLLFLIIFQSCNTLYNSRMIDIDILEPAKVKLPDDYQKVALRFNNANVAWNPIWASYSVEGKEMVDSTNLDSIASEVYFDLFAATLKEQHFFENISVLQAADYSTTQFLDTLAIPELIFSDSTFTQDELNSFMGVHTLTNELKKTKPSPNPVRYKKYIDPQFGLYSKEEISVIADTCSADVLLSLDHFYTQNGISYFDFSATANQVVLIHYFWTAYDLNKQNLAFHFSKTDTIFWSKMATNKKEAIRRLPPRKDAVLNAADIAGGNTAKFLVPHWTTVQRMYYVSGHVDLKQTSDMVEKGNWLEAAKYWKANVDNGNKNIAAKSMFNLAVACEMNDEMDAAIDWAVKSYYLFGENNEIHAANCKEYIRILAQRKRDRQLMDKQFNAE